MKKKVIIGIIIGIVVLLGVGVFILFSPQEAPVATAKTEALTQTTLQNTISATGNVESNQRTIISDTSNETINRIYVSLGDWVGNGDWLCQLYDKESETYTIVKATTSGTITSIKALIDTPANGELFMIEDTNDLRINGQVKETDVNKLSKNMAVNVKSDATGDKTFTGNLRTIAPTALASSEATASKKPEFAIDVNLNADVDGLKIGMTTNLNIISEERANVFAVSYDVLVPDGNGGYSIYIAKEDSENQGNYIVEAIPVTTGLETDIKIEIISDQLVADMEVITEPLTAQIGMPVFLEDQPGVTPEPATGESQENSSVIARSNHSNESRG